MGWNDHVEFVETQCLDCGVVSVWEFWDDTAKARYVGRIGEMLGHDVNKSGRCPDCGSTKGRPEEDEDDIDLSGEYGWSD